jgi:phytoene dehydrogenase-like protein
MESAKMKITESTRRDPDLIVVGGGLAGLSAAVLVARAGRSVVLLERAGHLGGRAATQVRDGVHFNLGPHALYCRGRAFRLFRELGVAFHGDFPASARGLLVLGNVSYPIPQGIGSLIRSRLLTFREKWRLGRLLTTLPGLDTRPLDRVPLRDWIAPTAGSGHLNALLRTLFRVSTYADDTERLSAGAALEQLKLALAGNVWYLDGGWQTLVDGLRDRAIEHGAEILENSGVNSVVSEGDGVSVELTGGEVLRSRAAVLAVGPKEACELLALPADAPLARWSAGCLPVKAACLDLALDRLPRPDIRVAFGLDGPLYYSVHSASATLAPDGVAVLHVMKYLGEDRSTPAEAAEQELEGFLHRLQPSWRFHTVARRFLPGMTVTPALPRADQGGLSGRPGVTIRERAGIFLAGDWVGAEGMLADASAASAEEAARNVLDLLERTPGRIERSETHAAR